MGRGRLLQLLSASLSPCCPYLPAGANRRIGQDSSTRAAFATMVKARPPDFIVTGPPMGSLALRPGDSLTTLKMALSVGFRSFGFPPACDSSYRAPDSCPGGTDSRWMRQPSTGRTAFSLSERPLPPLLAITGRAYRTPNQPRQSGGCARDRAGSPMSCRPCSLSRSPCSTRFGPTSAARVSRPSSSLPSASSSQSSPTPDGDPSSRPWIVLSGSCCASSGLAGGRGWSSSSRRLFCCNISEPPQRVPARTESIGPEARHVL